ncbi:MAG: CoA pyrophosphatase [Dehalococcoidia bacterium]|nr:CoA pyrophosphatase [Dehalococcoidia bacterium]
MDDFKGKVERLLRCRQPASGASLLVPSAVLMPFFEKDGQIHLLFTRRTRHVAHHKSQVSFPGGARDRGDATLLDTALRESAEEVGLDPHAVEILGVLNDVPTIASPYVITPYVGFVGSLPKLSLCREEVDHIIEVPLDTLLDDRYPRDECLEVEGIPRKVMAYRHGEDVIWGATARIVKQFVDILGPGLSARSLHQ